jgi:uncharacterized protein (DUF1499 family)
MTDKQIIIDGCDVQNCEFFNYCDTDVEFSECLAHWHPNEDYSNVYYASCYAYPNCYYKQLKRKEQECEAYKMEAEEGKEINAELKAEILSLKRGIEIAKEFDKTEIEKQIRSIKKLTKTLTEIKEIAEANKNYIYVLPSSSVAGDSLEFSFEFTKNILQKISECEVNDDNRSGN